MSTGLQQLANRFGLFHQTAYRWRWPVDLKQIAQTVRQKLRLASGDGPNEATKNQPAKAGPAPVEN